MVQSFLVFIKENDIRNMEGFLYYLAQALGCFSFIDREEKLRLIPYGANENKVVDSRHRYTSSFF